MVSWGVTTATQGVDCWTVRSAAEARSVACCLRCSSVRLSAPGSPAARSHSASPGTARCQRTCWSPGRTEVTRPSSQITTAFSAAMAR